MALATHSDLQTSIATWSKRSDQNALWPDIIAMAEARINRDLRVSRQITRDALVIAAEFTALPTDFAGIRSARLTDSPYTVLTQLTPEQMADYKITAASSGTARAASVVGTQLWVLPIQTSANTELVYYAKVPALSVTSPTNWLLTTHPDVYLWAALMEAHLFLEDEDQAMRFQGLFEAALQSVKSADLRDAMGATLAPSPQTNPV